MKNVKTVPYRCRGDFVLYRMVNKGIVNGVVMPDIASQGKERVVVAVGPKVEGLNVGDVILVIGTPGEDLVQLADERDIWMTREANVALVVLDPEHAEKS